MRWLFLLLLTIGYALEIEVSARSSILMNAETGAILYQKHAHLPLYPASITKIATALFVLDEKRPELHQLATVSAEALRIKSPKAAKEAPPYWGEVDGTKMGLIKGEALPLEALLHGLMRISGNDAANVLAESFAPSIPDFVEEMNEYLRDLGCLNTQFRNPHGLHHDEHVTTAYDMCLITRKALQIPKFREIVSNVPYYKPQTNKQAAGAIKQSNALLKSGKYFYRKAIGVKTGYHAKAMYTLVAAAEHEGRTLIAVLLGCEKREDRYEGAIRLFEKAFAETKEDRTIFTTAHLFTKEVEGFPLKAFLQDDLSLSYFPSEEPHCRAFIHWDPLSLPIHAGQKVGQVRLCGEEGALLVARDLYAREGIELPWWGKIRRFLSSL